MKKPMIIMLSCLGILFGVIFLYKAFISYKMHKGMASMKSPIITVSAMKASNEAWDPRYQATASLRAIRGVDVTTELAGMIRQIYFVPGADVKKGQLLVELNIDADVSQLHSLQANETLASITYHRDQKQYKAHAISKATLDTDYANLKSLQAQVAEQQATIDKKIIRAPFTGRLGISMVNPGQYLNPGDKIVTLQTMDPIYADFYIPQQTIGKFSIGQTVKLTSDSFPKITFTGKITTINPAVDTSTRNLEIEATIHNANYQLKPGMFASANVTTGKPENLLTLPQTAVSFNPYGSLVYILKNPEKEADGKTVYIATQSFVTTGETRGDQVVVNSGVKAGDLVVTSGQLKLKNKDRVVINNSVAPSDTASPNVNNES